MARTAQQQHVLCNCRRTIRLNDWCSSFAISGGEISLKLLLQSILQGINVKCTNIFFT